MLSINIRGIRELRRGLRLFERQIENPQRLLRNTVVPLIQREVRRIFQTRGYGVWPPTQAGNPPLIRSGRYLREATSASNIRITRNRLRLEVDLPYAQYHEEGTRRLPRREVFGLLARNTRFQNQLTRRLDRRLQRLAP